jgi:hypothetical protein
MKARLFFSTIVASIALPAVSHATGGVWCDIDDGNVAMHVKAAMSRDGTGPWWGVEGRVETRFGHLPRHLAAFAIGDANLTQRWLGREGVLLTIQKYDSEPLAAVMLTISTTPVDEGIYEGTYELRITADGGDAPYLTRTGKVGCGAD